MSDGCRHIVQKVRTELTVCQKGEHRRKSEHLRQAVQRAIEKTESLLDRFPEDELIRIDTLSVEIRIVDADFYRIEERIEKLLSEKIQQLINSSAPTDQSAVQKENTKRASGGGAPGKRRAEDHYEELITGFLRTGRLPWWGNAGMMNEAEKWMEKLPPAEQAALIRPVIRENNQVLKRLVRQFPEEITLGLIQKLEADEFGSDHLAGLLKEIVRFSKARDSIPGGGYRVITELFETALGGILSGVGLEKNVRKLASLMRNIGFGEKEAVEAGKICEQWITRIKQRGSGEADARADPPEGTKEFKTISKAEKHEAGDKKPAVENQERQEIRDSVAADDAFAVNNSGLVILYPFLGSLFGNLGFTEKGLFLNRAAQERAVCLTHYLAAGETEFAEYDLNLPKFLCGWPLGEPVGRFMPVKKTWKEECSAVLASAITHWDALKNTSVRGLRENFLQRDGLLKKEAFGWSLYVEEKAHDILLEQLPWGLSVVKLPWMEEMLTVQWR